MMKFAIVGCGHISKKHIQAIENLDNAELVAVCDTLPDRLKEFEEAHGVRGFESLDEMLQALPEIDVISICVPSGLHARIAIKVAEAKKHIIVEKPIALTVEDADLIIKACEKNGVKLSVVHPNRFRPAVVALKDALEKGCFGKLSHVNATVRWNRNQDYYDQAAWRGTKAMDGGVLMNQAIHNLDLLLWLAGPVDEVQAYSATRFRNIETEDVSVSVLRFASGALGVVEAAATVYPSNYEESLSVFGETGTAVISGKTANWIKHWDIESIDEELTRNLIEEINNDPYGVSGHQQIIKDMIDSIHQDRPPVVTGEDGKNALKLVLAIYEASERSKNKQLVTF